jgi:hypothetical protein
MDIQSEEELMDVQQPIGHPIGHTVGHTVVSDLGDLLLTVSDELDVIADQYQGLNRWERSRALVTALVPQMIGPHAESLSDNTFYHKFSSRVHPDKFTRDMGDKRVVEKIFKNFQDAYNSRHQQEDDLQILYPPQLSKLVTRLESKHPLNWNHVKRILNTLFPVTRTMDKETLYQTISKVLVNTQQQFSDETAIHALDMIDEVY